MKIRNPKIYHCVKSPNCQILREKVGAGETIDLHQTYSKNFSEATFTRSICIENLVHRFFVNGHLICKFCITKVKSRPHCGLDIGIQGDNEAR